MEFRKCDDQDDQHVDVLLPRFSVAIMSDEARYEWSHGITPRLADVVRALDSSHASSQSSGLTLLKRGVRTSLTFRNVRHSAICQCSMYLQSLLHKTLLFYCKQTGRFDLWGVAYFGKSLFKFGNQQEIGCRTRRNVFFGGNFDFYLLWWYTIG